MFIGGNNIKLKVNRLEISQVNIFKYKGSLQIVLISTTSGLRLGLDPQRLGSGKSSRTGIPLFVYFKS